MKTIGLLGGMSWESSALYYRKIVHQVIFDELVLGIVRDESRTEFLRIVHDRADRGAAGVIEACTEIVLLVQQKHTQIPLFDTTSIHVQKAVEIALG